MHIKVIERAQAIQVEEQEILRRSKELEAIVRQPAEAERYRLEKLAEANRFKDHIHQRERVESRTVAK